MATKPLVPPKPKNLSSVAKLVLSSSTSLEPPDGRELCSSHVSVISRPFFPTEQIEPQFFHGATKNGFKSYYVPSLNSSQTSSAPSVDRYRRPSLPEGHLHSIIKKHGANDYKSLKNPERIVLPKFSSDTDAISKVGVCREINVGAVTKTKKQLINRIGTNRDTEYDTSIRWQLQGNAGKQLAPHEFRQELPAKDPDVCEVGVVSSDGNSFSDGKRSSLSAGSAEVIDGFPMSTSTCIGSFQRSENLLDTDLMSSDSEKSDIVQLLYGGAAFGSLQSVSTKASKIAAEIVDTEYNYLQCLKLLLDEFPRIVQGSIPSEELGILLKGLPEIRKFSEDFLSDLQCCMESYEESGQIAPVFLKKGKYLMLYIEYVKDFEKMIDTYRALLRRYPNFADMVAKFERSPSCKSLPLVEYFHKPVQRLPRYPLLLGTYLRSLEDDHPDRENAKEALDLVSDITTKANTSLVSVEKVSRLLWYQARTLGYTFLQSNRTFIREGSLKKLSRKTLQERVVLLCSDAIICGEFDSLGRFTVNAEYPLAEIKVELLDADYFDRDLEFGVYSKKKSSAFQASSIEERNSWMTAICRAIEEIQKIRLRTCALRDNELTKLSFAPIWIPDYRVQACQLCKRTFSLFRRYHHCRVCGYAVCHACSQHEVEIHFKDHRPKRVCNKCFPNFRKEEKHFPSGRVS